MIMMMTMMMIFMLLFLLTMRLCCIACNSSSVSEDHQQQHKLVSVLEERPSAAPRPVSRQRLEAAIECVLCCQPPRVAVA
jgi:hypothetical protein